MTPFQSVTLAVLGLAILRDVLRLRRGSLSVTQILLRTSVWIATGVAVSQPRLIQLIASALGVGRGADILLYGTVLCFLFFAFYTYSAKVRLERQLTQVVRSLAIRDARSPTDTGDAKAHGGLPEN